ncbi:hypothetical protein JXA32_03990 [Candidatus Sumerlaeota bacterium]|nr:hypothetical protein [Candidatus Sumerlaeota bacterium]
MATTSSGSTETPKEGFDLARWTLAIMLSIISALFVCVVTPYNNFVIANSFISDSYLPVASVFCITLISLIVNPLIRSFFPSLALNFKQLTLIFVVLLAVAVTPSSGLLRVAPYCIAYVSSNAGNDTRLAEIYEALDPPASLFPDNLKYGVEKPVAEPFVGELDPGEKIPWGAWIPPLISWSGYLIPFWLMMVAMGVIVFPQWRDNERLPFPLLTVQRMLIESPESGKRLPPIFTRRSFQIALIGVFILHFFAELDANWPGTAPVIPLSWNITRYFSEAPFNYLPEWIRINRIYFMFLGIAFFMPNRVGFSIWCFQILWAMYVMIDNAYFPPYHHGSLDDHNTGAVIALALIIIWLGRSHWVHVIKCMFGKIANSDDWSYMISGWAFVLACIGMGAWLHWVKVPFPYILFLVTMAVFIGLAMTRVIAEAGLPMLGVDSVSTMRMLRLIPAAFHTPASAWFGGIVSLFNGSNNRLCVAVLTTHAIGLDREATQSKRMSTGGIVLMVIILSMVVCGAVHLYAGYHHSMSLDGRESPLSIAWGGTCFNWTANAMLFEQQKGMMSAGNYNQIGHLCFGFSLAIVLQYLCTTFPWWPLHPVALMFVGTWYVHQLWVSVFLGWLLKVLILRYGGSRVYRSAAPFFIGLVIGEVLSVAFWVAVSGIRAFSGLPYQVVEILPY